MTHILENRVTAEGIQFIRLSQNAIVDSETYENVILDYDQAHDLVAIEVLPFRTGKK